MRNRAFSTYTLLILACIGIGCGQGRSIEDIHNELTKKFDREKVVEIAWDREQKEFSSLPESKQEEFQNSFCGMKVRTTVKIREFKTGDMSQFQKSFAGFDYYAKEKFNFNRLMVVVGNGPNYNGIETVYIVFLPHEHFFDFLRDQVITVEGLIDSVSFTFYNSNIMLYPARLISK